ncbi:hypothetical protein B0H21DRAFT_778217 [Amylocystis lapponica]|nr:hypothetical protein B0H21DRAFT_778217 [Amylocystis lapponica]
MDHNPWLPTGPGKHGFMQVGLGREKTAFNTPEIRHVFVGAGKRLKYCGLYEVSRVDPLSIAEWGSLPEKVRETYVKTTASKEKHENHGTKTQIRTKYDSGVLLAPCVLLRCVEFDIKFYGELVAAMDQHVSQGSAKKPRLAAPRAEQDDDSQDETDDDEVVFADDTGGQTNQEPPSGVSNTMAARSPRRSGRLSIRLPARRSNYSEDSPDDGER